MLTEIKFGTDGWRAVIADGFTIQNLRRVAQATCDVLKKTSKNRLVLIGWDNRFFSEKFADTAAQVFMGNGFKVEMAEDTVTSPVVSLSVKDRKAAIGVMITASHNPSQFSGFKLKCPQGGSVNSGFTRSIEERVDSSDIHLHKVPGKKVDFLSGYNRFLKKNLKLELLKHIKSTVIFDAMHGPGGDVIAKLLGKSNKIHVINNERDPLFGGVNPEPIEVNLTRLKDAVKKHSASAGLAVDGDGDRMGVVDDKGRYLPPHTVMPLLMLHLLENRKMKGKIIQTVSMGYLPQRIAAEFKVPFEEVPVGFKNIAAKMHQEKVLFGGEESGGYGVGQWFPERDGILCSLLLLEMMALKKKPLSALVDELYNRFGASHFKRVDFVLPSPVDKNEWVNRIMSHVGPTAASKPVKTIVSIDGVKIILDDNSWVLMRPSGTEPLIRTYAESSSTQTVNDLLTEADRLVHIAPPPPTKGQRSGGKKSGKKKK